MATIKLFCSQSIYSVWKITRICKYTTVRYLSNISFFTKYKSYVLRTGFNRNFVTFFTLVVVLFQSSIRPLFNWTTTFLLAIGKRTTGKTGTEGNIANCLSAVTHFLWSMFQYRLFMPSSFCCLKTCNTVQIVTEGNNDTFQCPLPQVSWSLFP